MELACYKLYSIEIGGIKLTKAIFDAVEFQLKIFSSNLICDKRMFVYPSHVTRKKPSAETEKNGRVQGSLRSLLITCETIYRPRKLELWPVIKSSSSVLFCGLFFVFCFFFLIRFSLRKTFTYR